MSFDFFADPCSVSRHFTRQIRQNFLLQFHTFIGLADRQIEQSFDTGMSFVFVIIGALGSFIMIQEEGIVGVCEHNVFSKKGSFKEGMIAVYLLENIVIPMHKPKLTAAFA